MADSKNSQKQITLIDLFAVLWQRKFLVIGITVAGMIGVLIFSIASILISPEKSPLPNKYTPSAQMLINDGGKDTGLSSMLSSSGLSSVASLAGVNVSGGTSNSSLASYLVSSNKTLDEIVEKFDLINRYEIKNHEKANSREALRKVLSSNYDEETGVFTVSFTDIDPVFACEVVNYVVKILERRFEEIGVDKNLLSKVNLEENIENTYLNIQDLQKEIRKIENSVSNVYSANGTPSIMMDTTMVKMELEVQEKIYAQLKAQYEMLKVTMASEQPVFQILEYAEIPDRKSSPSRGKLCIIVTFASAFIAVFMAFLLDAISDLKMNTDVVAKFKGSKNE